MANDIIDQIKQVFWEKEFDYHCNEEGGRIGTILSKGALLYAVHDRMVECQYVFKRKVLPEQTSRVLEYINNANMSMWEGHFEIEKDGIVKYRIITDISETQEISNGRLETMMIKAMKSESKFGEALFEVADGLRSPDNM